MVSPKVSRGFHACPRVIFFFVILIFLFSSGNSRAELIDGFNHLKTRVIKKRGDFIGGGEKGARTPFVKSGLVTDAARGKVMRIDFNVSDGYGGTYLIFRKGKVSPEFNTVTFWVRGSLSAFKAEIKDEAIHQAVVPKRRNNGWQEITLPLSGFSNAGSLEKDKIKEFVFVFEDHRTAPRLGTIFVDDLQFVKAKETRLSASDLPVPGPVLVNGNLPKGGTFQAGDRTMLRLSNRLLRAGRPFKTFRFEASRDRHHWFYLHAVPHEDQNDFEFDWPIGGMISGRYNLRAVAADEAGLRKAGPVTAFHIQNHNDFDYLLNEVEKAAFQYFVEEVHPRVFLVKDRDTEDIYAAGLSGFQMTAYVIGVERGWMSKDEALKRIRTVLNFFLFHAPRYHGLISHWFGPDRRETREKGIGDVVETAYVLAGALVARQYFSGGDAAEVSLRKKVDQFSSGIEWDTLLRRRKKEDETGLLPWLWHERQGAWKLEIRGYNEAMIAYLLALGAPAHAIPASSWRAWASSYQKGRYGGYELIACAPLFTHQYSHLWIDFRGIHDEYADYFENSIRATLANREYSLRANGYPLELWGLTASEGPNGYKAYGAPPTASPVPVLNDGTIAPAAAAASIMFTPSLSIAAVKSMRRRFPQLWGKYGFKDAFNPRRKWQAKGYLGLNEGAMVIGIENYRTGLVWKLFMKNYSIQQGLKKAGFHT